MQNRFNLIPSLKSLYFVFNHHLVHMDAKWLSSLMYSICVSFSFHFSTFYFVYVLLTPSISSPIMPFHFPVCISWRPYWLSWTSWNLYFKLSRSAIFSVKSTMKPMDMLASIMIIMYYLNYWMYPNYKFITFQTHN